MEDISIAESVRECLELFQTLNLLPLPLSNASYQTALIAITEEEPRFKVWSGNIGAHASGRRSLQFRLRDASHLQKQVLALLADLSELLEDALAIIQGNKVPWDQIEDEEIQADDIDSLEDDSDDGELPATELEQIASSVPDAVNCLLRLSVAIRNPAPHDRFAISVPIDVSHYEFFDVQHVQAKFPNIDNHLAQRLGNAISRRRQYFRYRESHHLKLAHGLDLKDQADGKSTIASSIPGHAKSAGFDNRLSVIDEDALSDAGISQTSFASSLADTQRLRIPPLPKRAKSGPFECPFCYMIITATNRASWKRHVFADLKPYICLSNDCTAAENSFSRRHEWILHEIQSHRKFYVCPYSCSETFQSQSKCIEHVRKSHSSTVLEHQLEAMINLNSRSIQTDNGVACPMCQESLDSLKKYQRHVGRHQEELAIFALPSTESQDNKDDLDDDESSPRESDIDSDNIITTSNEVIIEVPRVDEDNSIGESHPDVHNPDPSNIHGAIDNLDGDWHANYEGVDRDEFLAAKPQPHFTEWSSNIIRGRYRLNEQLQQLDLQSGSPIHPSSNGSNRSRRTPSIDIYINGKKVLERESSEYKAEQERAKEDARQREIEDKIRKDAEEALDKKIEEMRLEAEEAKREIERARAEAERAAYERLETEKKVEEERRRLMAQAEEEARLRFEAEVNSAEERRRAEEEAQARAEEAARLRLEAAIRAEAEAKVAAEKKAIEEAARIEEQTHLRLRAAMKAEGVRKAAKEAVRIKEEVRLRVEAALKADAEAKAATAKKEAEEVERLRLIHEEAKLKAEVEHQAQIKAEQAAAQRAVAQAKQEAEELKKKIQAETKAAIDEANKKAEEAAKTQKIK